MRLMQYAGAEVPGGLLRHVEILVQGLAAAGHEVHAVLSPAPGVDEVATACMTAGASVTRLTVRGKTDVGGMVRLASLVAAGRPGGLSFICIFRHRWKRSPRSWRRAAAGRDAS